MIRILALVAVVGLLIAAVVVRRRRHVQRSVSDDWLCERRRRECRAGVELPRWRFPAERRELAKRDRLTRISEARQQTGERRRA